MCPGREEIEALLNSDEVNDVHAQFREHAQSCARCRALAAEVADGILVIMLVLKGGHLEPLSLSEYLDDELPQVTRLLVDLHLQACPHCRARVESMREKRSQAFSQSPREYSFRPVEVAAQQSRVRIPRAATALAGAAALLVITLSVGGRFLPRPGDLPGTTTTGIGGEPRESPTSNAPVTRGSAPTAGSEVPITILITPRSDAKLQGETVTVSWKLVKGAKRYEVRIYLSDQLETPYTKRFVAGRSSLFRLSPGNYRVWARAGIRGAIPAERDFEVVRGR